MKQNLSKEDARVRYIVGVVLGILSLVLIYFNGINLYSGVMLFVALVFVVTAYLRYCLLYDVFKKIMRSSKRSKE